MTSPTRPPASKTSVRRRLLGRGLWLSMGLLVGALVSHCGYWYVPRPRAAHASESRLLRQLPEADLKIWVPYPHQNLPMLAGLVENPGPFVDALARLVGHSTPSSPTLGPWGIPPSSEIALAVDLDGKSAVVAARPFLTLRLIARAAGWLADNPWLAGGRIETSDGPLRVEWRSGAWWVLRESDGAGTAGLSLVEETLQTEEPSKRVSSSLGAKALAQLEVTASNLGVPPGAYGLSQSGQGLILAPAGATVGELDELPRFDSIEKLSILRLGPRAELLMIFSEVVKGGELPSAVVVAATTETAYRSLPGSKLLGRVSDLPVGRVGDLVVLATDRRGLALAMASQSNWLPLARRAEEEQLSGFWVHLESAERMTDGLADLFEDVPLISPREAQRWRDVQVVLAGLRRFGSVSAWWSPEGGQARLE